jgi:Ca-activated chloride channel homolog
LVALNVTVTDGQGRVVRGLTQDAFSVMEEDVTRPIQQFAAGSVPLSLVIAIDASQSMAGPRIEFARQAVLRFLERLSPDDELDVFGFNDRPFNITRGNKDAQAITRALAGVRPKGGTAFYNAVAAGIEALQRAKHRRRALVIISDGNDEMSDRYDDGRASLAREAVAAGRINRSEAMVYAIGVDPPNRRALRPLNMGALTRLTDPTGGATRLVVADDGILTAAEQIGDELRHQYVIGFAPAHPGDAKFHRVQVTVAGCHGCVVHTRAGFIADTNSKF